MILQIRTATGRDITLAEYNSDYLALLETLCDMKNAEDGIKLKIVTKAPGGKTIRPSKMLINYLLAPSLVKKYSFVICLVNKANDVMLILPYAGSVEFQFSDNDKINTYSMDRAFTNDSGLKTLHDMCLAFDRFRTRNREKFNLFKVLSRQYDNLSKTK